MNVRYVIKQNETSKWIAWKTENNSYEVNYKYEMISLKALRTCTQW